MRILDLFCGGGGAAVGLKQACPEAEIVGVDRDPQPEYPFEFIQADALRLGASFLREFDFIWASPPCQSYSAATPIAHRKNHPDLVAPVRDLLEKSGRPWVMENVVLSPLRRDLLLCGEMFSLGVQRHRLFEISGFGVRQPQHVPHKGITDRWARKTCRPELARYSTVAGYGEGRAGRNIVREWQTAMEISHIQNKRTLAQAVPPAYSKYILQEYLARRPQQLFFF